MKVIGTVVDDKRTMIGLLMSGKDKEFGGVSDTEVQRPVSIQQLFRMNFENFQIECSKKNQILEKGSFKLKSLEMYLVTDNGLVKVNNSIKLLARVYVDGELLGFDVDFAGRRARLRTADIIRQSAWYNTENFVVKTSDTKRYIAGKAGSPLDTLPEVNINTDKAKRKETATSSNVRNAVTKEEVAKEAFDTDFDMVTLFAMLAKLKGLVVKLPNEKYVKNTVNEKKASDEFVPLGIGEVASPYIDYGDKKVNFTAKFRKVGTVTAIINGGPMMLYTYTVASKNIYLSGERHIKKIGAVVPEEGVEEFLSVVKKSLSVTEITDESITKPIRAIQGDTAGKLRFFEMNTENIEKMSKKTAKACMLSEKDIYHLVKQAEHMKATNKYLNSVIKSAKDAISRGSEEDPRPKYGLYAGFSNEMLEMVKEAGIDPFTGAFTKTMETTEKTDAQAGEVQAKLNGVETKDDVEVIYSIKGLSVSKVTAADLTNKKPSEFMLDSMIELVDSFERMESSSERLSRAMAESDVVGKFLNTNREKLWRHKIANITLSTEDAFMLDMKKWQEVPTRSKAKTARKFECIVPGCEGLTLDIKGITVIPMK